MVQLAEKLLSKKAKLDSGSERWVQLHRKKFEEIVYVSHRHKQFPKGSRRCKTAEFIQEFKQLPPSEQAAYNDHMMHVKAKKLLVRSGVEIVEENTTPTPWNLSRTSGWQLRPEILQESLGTEPNMKVRAEKNYEKLRRVVDTATMRPIPTPWHATRH